jgi:hypothetical protein
MACCGCPDAYEDHALRAADFALGLADAFARAGASAGVTHLCCRVGLHSGPVVAGVLRAEKHRFQLFGDTVRVLCARCTALYCALALPRCAGAALPHNLPPLMPIPQVNTASRMESTGEPRRVQCSAATAELLLHSGRHTLRRRGVIAVKGKGSVTTYWLTGRLGRHRAGGRPRRTQSGPSGGVGASPAGGPLSAEEAARRAAVTADDLVTIVVAETAPAGSARLGKDDSPAISEVDDAAALAAAARAEAEADAALEATQLAVLVALDVTEDGTVRVVIDDTVTIDTSPDAVAESMSLGPRTASTSSRDAVWVAALALAAAGDDA